MRENIRENMVEKVMREYISIMWLVFKKRYERVYKGNVYGLFDGDDSV